MPRRRTGSSFTVFAILNFIAGGSLFLCALTGAADMTVEVNNRDLTKELRAFLDAEIPGYSVYKIGGAVLGFLLGAGLIASGVGLLKGADWGRVLALVCAFVAVVHHVGTSVLQLFFVNPAMTKFFGRHGPINFSFLPKFIALVGVVFMLGWVVYFVIEIAILLTGGGRPARVCVAEEEWDDRPRRRAPARYEDEDEDYDEPPRRPPRRPRPRYEDEDEDDEPPPRRRR